jgi:CheY-like chemotaxis protein/CHASE3 domain sensor protein
MLAGYMIVFALMIVLAVVSYQSSRSMLEIQQKVDQSHTIISKAHLIQKIMVDMQTGLRGYVITGDENYLEPYDKGRISYTREIAQLRSLVEGNTRQLDRLEEIDRLVEEWLDKVAMAEIRTRQEVSRGALTLGSMAERIREEGAGRQLFEDIRDIAAGFVEMQRNLMDDYKKESVLRASRDTLVIVGGTVLAVILGVCAMLVIIRNVRRQVGGEPAEIADVTEQIARGDLDAEIKDGVGILGSVGRMLDALRKNRDKTNRDDWLKTGIARLNEALSGDPDINILASKAISEIANCLDIHVGALYVTREENGNSLTLLGSYAYTKRKNLSSSFEIGEGLVGQAALEKQQILVKNVPEDYFRVTSGLGESLPSFLCVTPFFYEGKLRGVVEVATLNDMTQSQLDYLEQAMSILAVAVESAHGRTQLRESLEESQRLTEELQAQQAELKTSNEELEMQAQRLKESEERLRVQQEELEVTNTELEEKNDLLERQKKEVEQARKDIAVKADELALASKYKSEFLANMSHELRTPLNSLLLLAQGLVKNKEGNLTPEQVESAEVIHGSGSDLLNLINEILDLSKVEAGRMDLHLSGVRTSDLAEGVKASFAHMLKEKGLDLNIIQETDAPAQITSDRKRLEQIIRNLVSNAIKFTHKGSVSVTFGRPSPDADLSRSGIEPDQCLAIKVKDTGIGIAPEQHRIIFEAFQQADGGTARKYGGTGLGLSISREIAGLLGGEIQLESAPDKGSTFTLFVPLSISEGEKSPQNQATTVTVSRPKRTIQRSAAAKVSTADAGQVSDDRAELSKGDQVILIIEDDVNFTRLLIKTCHEKGLKGLAASSGEAGLDLAAKNLPSAVILDIGLPGMDGWSVLEALKEDTRTRHIPVHIISAEEASTESLRRGAVGHAVKPIAPEGIDETFKRLEQVFSKQPRSVLVVDDDAMMRKEIIGLIGSPDVRVDEAGNGAEALEALQTNRYDCMVLDLGLPDMDGRELLERLESRGDDLPPVIVHTARDMGNNEERALREYAESIVIKDVRSQERLLDEVSLFLHRVVSQMPEKQQKIIRNLHDTDELLRGKKILVVDDDLRTTFAMSRLLSDRDMVPLKAENGERALKILEEQDDVDIVLMDVMMPVMDGYEAIGRIRSQERFKKLPIIALTAKAMPEDAEKCLTAGANDYLPKPVDEKRLVSMMRVWLYR